MSCSSDSGFEASAALYCEWELACTEAETTVDECTENLIEENLRLDENGDDYRACKDEISEYFDCMRLTECDDSSECDELYDIILVSSGCEDWDS